MTSFRYYLTFAGGDNVHSTMWGSASLGTRGWVIESFTNNTGLSFFNYELKTSMDARTGKFDGIDFYHIDGCH